MLQINIPSVKQDVVPSGFCPSLLNVGINFLAAKKTVMNVMEFPLVEIETEVRKASLVVPTFLAVHRVGLKYL